MSHDRRVRSARALGLRARGGGFSTNRRPFLDRRFAMRLREMIGRRSARVLVACRRVRRPLVEWLEDRAVPAGYTAASVGELINVISAANVRGGVDTFAAVAGRPPSAGHSLAGRGL